MDTLCGPIATNPICARTMIRADSTPTGRSTIAQKVRAAIDPSINTAAMITPQLSMAQPPATSVMPARNLIGAVHLGSISTLSARAFRRLSLPAYVISHLGGQTAVVGLAFARRANPIPRLWQSHGPELLGQSLVELEYVADGGLAALVEQ